MWETEEERLSLSQHGLYRKGQAKQSRNKENNPHVKMITHSYSLCLLWEVSGDKLAHTVLLIFFLKGLNSDRTIIFEKGMSDQLCNKREEWALGPFVLVAAVQFLVCPCVADSDRVWGRASPKEGESVPGQEAPQTERPKLSHPITRWRKFQERLHLFPRQFFSLEPKWRNTDRHMGCTLELPRHVHNLETGLLRNIIKPGSHWEKITDH